MWLWSACSSSKVLTGTGKNACPTLSVALGVGKRGMFLLHDGGERGFDHSEAFVELPVGDYQRNEDANHIVESAGGNGDEAVLVAIHGDGFGFRIRGLAGPEVPHPFQCAHAAQTPNGAHPTPLFFPEPSGVF